jgi:predicted nucleic acid-binding Zn ribbon protein
MEGAAVATPVLGHVVECTQCGKRTTVFDGGNVHDALDCPCCGSDHKHADENGATAESCRPVKVFPNSVVAMVGD